MMNRECHAVFAYRWCKSIPIIAFLCYSLGLTAQSTNKSLYSQKDSVLMRTTLYFSTNKGKWIEKSEYKKVGKFLKWALTDTVSVIHLIGWTDKTGPETFNEKLSLRRARSVRNYLVRKGVSSERIQFKGEGIDAQAPSRQEARRVDMLGLPLVPVADTPHEAKPIVETPLVKVEKKEPASSAEKEEPQQEVVLDTPLTSPWYIGFGAGLSFGRGTFCSFAADKTRAGFQIGILGGYRINRFLSAEATLDYSHLKLGAYDCCQNFWLSSNGNRYLAPLTGTENYPYRDLISSVNLVSLGAHLMIDLLPIWQDGSRWSALVSPTIYGVYSSADVLNTSSKAHFGMGVDLGAGYQLTGRMGLRFSTGINYLTGQIDGLPSIDHKANYVWNTALKLIIKL